MKAAAFLAAPLALSACVGTGSGWSRASDLSVYSSAHAYARIAWEQSVYCEGTSPERASASLDREFGAREAAVRTALASRLGEAAIAGAGRHWAQRVPCGDVPDPQWRQRYSRLLRMLEIRLGLA